MIGDGLVSFKPSLLTKLSSATADPDLLTFEYLRNKCENETPANYIANGYLPGHRRETLFVLITEVLLSRRSI